jgi:hypothetical protein
MSFRDQILILGFILLLVILFSLGTSGVVVPYSPNNLFSKEYPYEGFDGPSSPEPSKKPDNINGGMPKSVVDAMMASMPPKVPEKESMGTATPVKTEGFSGLQSSAYGKEAPLDIFSQQTSGQNCAASPYSNSLGYLCLDKNAVGLLNTRGGNATGKDAQIGSP